MPYFSVCISAYNCEQYLPACLDSVLCQEFTDFEIVIVDDASTDGTARVIDEYAARDARIKAIYKPVNEGLHLGHHSTVAAAEGRYVLFLDADDEFESDLLSKLAVILADDPAPMLHFGIRVVGENGVSQKVSDDFAQFVNCEVETLAGSDINDAVFGGCGEYRQDWRIPQRVYSRSLIKRAFCSMPARRLDCAEDAYEFFIISSMASRQITRNDVVGIVYHLGRGLNGASDWSAGRFSEVAASFGDCIGGILDYAKQRNSTSLVKSAEKGAFKLYQLLYNDWLDRVPDSEKIDAALVSSEALGTNVVASEVMRCVRDAAWELICQGGKLSDRPCVKEWFDLAQQLGDAAERELAGYASRQEQARAHIEQLTEAERCAHFDEQSVRIFVSTHKDVALFDSEILQPVQVGSSRASRRFSWALHDDVGENISDLNPMYCELTTQYWAWKNIDADYVGFCHYRRYFDFSDKPHKENKYGEVMDDFIDAEAKAEYNLDDAFILNLVSQYDVITTPLEDVRKYSGKTATMRSHYDAADRLYVEDLDKVMDIAVRQHPEYEQDVRGFLSGHVARFCNMFVMRKEIFHDYCEWLFPILGEFVEQTDMSLYSKEGLRTPGHLSERLLNVYLLHHERVGSGWKMKQLQCVHFTNPERDYLPTVMVGGDESKPIIPVAFAADNNYVPMVSTTIYSMLKNASRDYRYDVYVLSRNINADNRRRMICFFSLFGADVSLRFVDVSMMVDDYDLATNNPHISVETYYRFLIQELLPFYDKVLYLDSDLIVKEDISGLYETNLGDNLLAAVRDLDFLAHINTKNDDRVEYAKTVLGMNDPYSYFQAGVLLLNIKAMREYHTIEEWLTFAGDERFIYNDQDALNAQCEGRITYIDYSWNVMTDCAGRINGVFAYAPAFVYDAFLDSREHEKIVHYAGYEKPWSHPRCDRSDLYWSYARQTPFYENLLSCIRGKQMPASSPIDDHEPAVSEDSPLRKIVDPIAPLGTARREVLKSAGRFIRGKK